eukprot:SAG11_NODE_340_length_10476_cov_6.009155_11_plen_108_part_00
MCARQGMVTYLEKVGDQVTWRTASVGDGACSVWSGLRNRSLRHARASTVGRLVPTGRSLIAEANCGRRCCNSKWAERMEESCTPPTALVLPHCPRSDMPPPLQGGRF